MPDTHECPECERTKAKFAEAEVRMRRSSAKHHDTLQCPACAATYVLVDDHGLIDLRQFQDIFDIEDVKDRKHP